MIAGLPVGAFAVAAMLVVWVSKRPPDSSRYDAVVVFAGGDNRVERAYELLRKGAAPAVIISPAGLQALQRYERLFGPPANAAFILEEKADTTFTNALFTARLIREHHLSSVLLVTSDYHMPRAMALLWLALATTDCRIGVHPVATRYAAPSSWPQWVYAVKLAYNEWVQVWGSLIEGALYGLGPSDAGDGRRATRESVIFMLLRTALLFDIPDPDAKNAHTRS